MRPTPIMQEDESSISCSTPFNIQQYIPDNNVHQASFGNALHETMLRRANERKALRLTFAGAPSIGYFAPAAASSITLATSFGCDNIATWLEGSVVVVAFICLAMLASCPGSIM